jgi:phytoene desaturase
MGGTGRVIDGIVSLIKGQGNTIRYEAPVSQILVNNKRAIGVELENGEQLAANIVVSNADSAFTYQHLVPAPYRRRWSDAKLKRAKYSMSLFVWYFGTSKQYPDVPHHMIMLGERYKGLLSNIFDAKVLSDDFSLYLHAPTITDRSLAPDGCESFYVLSPVPHLGQADIDWEETQQRYGDAILAALEDYLPGLRESVVTRRHFTPREFKSELNAHQGSAFSVAPKLTQSAFFRPHNRDDKIPGLYIVGAGTHPGAGVPGVINTAKATVGVIEQDYGVRSHA